MAIEASLSYCWLFLPPVGAFGDLWSVIESAAFVDEAIDCLACVRKFLVCCELASTATASSPKCSILTLGVFLRLK